MTDRSREAKSLPTELDINVFDSLDERSAVQRFHGKWRDEIEDRCRDGFAMRVIHDLRWMGYPAFSHYVEAVVNYLESTASADDSDAVSCFLGLIEFRLDEGPPAGDPWPSVQRGVNQVLADYEKYQVIPQIYGDLRPRLLALCDRIRPLLP